VDDILIIGAGAAGMTSAIRAAQRGKKVTVLEKMNKVGGTLSLTAGHLSGAATQRQLYAGIQDTTDSHYNDIVRICRDTMDPIITRKAVDLAPSTIDWLTELGYPFHDRAPAIIYGHEAYTMARTYFGKEDVHPRMQEPGQTILRLLLPLWDEQVQKGNIRLFTGCKLKQILVDKNSVEGIVAEQDDREFTFTAHHYLLTTGGYASSLSFFENSPPGTSQWMSAANPASTGDGIKAALQIGAVFQGAEKQMYTLGGIELQPGSGRVNFWEAWARMSNSIDRKQREIYVNMLGERFMNEFDWSVDQRERAMLAQPGKKCWILFDQRALYDGDSLVPQWTTDQLVQESYREQAVWQAPSLRELAVKTGLPPEAVEATVNKFNESCALQSDSQWGRTYLEHPLASPPYFAVLVYAYALISFGGLQVNEQLQVVRAEGQTIDNLYAAGEILGAAATSGQAFCGGMLLTPAISFGKWLGDHL
jgi:fumarate reductase flavoprotein subunit